MKRMANFVIQIVILAAVLSMLVLIVVQKRASKTPYEITSKYERIKTAVYDLKNNAIVITDAENKVVLWNQGAQKLFGKTEAQMLGHDLREIGICLSEIAQQDTPIDTEALHGLESYIPISLTVSESKVDSVSQYMGIIKGIGERKRKEQLLLRELELLNHSEACNKAGSSSWDADTNRIMITDGGNKIFQCEDLVTDAETLQKKIYYEDKPKVQAAFLKAVETFSSYTYRYRIQHDDGQIIWVESKGKILLRPNGTIERVLTFIKEVDGDFT